MKKILQLFTILSLLFVIACKPGAGSSSANGTLVGTWKYADLNFDSAKIPEDKKAMMASAKGMMAGMFKAMKIKFNADGTCEMIMEAQSDKAKYTVEGSKIKVTPEGGGESMNMEMLDNKLHMKIDQEEMHVDIAFDKE